MSPEISRKEFFAEAGKWTSRIGVAGLIVTTGKALWDARSLLNAQNGGNETSLQGLTVVEGITKQTQKIQATNTQVDIDTLIATASSAAVVAGTAMKVFNSDLK